MIRSEDGSRLDRSAIDHWSLYRQPPIRPLSNPRLIRCRVRGALVSCGKTSRVSPVTAQGVRKSTRVGLLSCFRDATVLEWARHEAPGRHGPRVFTGAPKGSPKRSGRSPMGSRSSEHRMREASQWLHSYQEGDQSANMQPRTLVTFVSHARMRTPGSSATQSVAGGALQSDALAGDLGSSRPLPSIHEFLDLGDPSAACGSDSPSAALPDSASEDCTIEMHIRTDSGFSSSRQAADCCLHSGRSAHR